MSGTHYYYDHMNKEQQKAYYAMKEGLLSIAPSFPVPRLPGPELAQIYFRMRLDCPEIFYSARFKYRFYESSSNVELIPEYLFPKAKIEEHQKAMQSRIRKIVRQAQECKPEDREKFIHDFILDQVHYDKLEKDYSHEILGPLGQGVGVCEGIAKTVKILCDELDIWCMIPLAEADPSRGVRYRHAWNIIKTGNQYYHLDATFDNSLSRTGEKRYDYYNLSDSQIFRDHQPLVWPAPECPDSSHTYYREKKISFTKKEDVMKRAASSIRKGTPFLFQWRGGYLTRQVLSDLMNSFLEEASVKGRNVTLSLNWPQAVLLVNFPKEEPDRKVIWESADEGDGQEIFSEAFALAQTQDTLYNNNVSVDSAGAAEDNTNI